MKSATNQTQTKPVATHFKLKLQLQIHGGASSPSLLFAIQAGEKNWIKKILLYFVF